MAGIRVYVLGAGCSYHEQGYPLATHFISSLSSYASKIAGRSECKRIHAAVEHTVALLVRCQSGPCDASTIDQLISLILNGRCDEYLKTLRPKVAADVVGLRYEAVRNAKIATSACFLDREPTARTHLIHKYRQFIQRKVLDQTGVSASCLARIRHSNARVLSFNYDRLYELAFFGSIADHSVMRFDPYSAEVLNSGLTAFGDIVEIEPDRFCFLKLHGSIGMRCSEDAFGQKIHRIDDVMNWKEIIVVDELIFPASSPAIFPLDPLITFPYEKDFIVAGRENKLPFRGYTAKVWAHATEVLRQASEIWIIGYSFDPTDCEHLIERIRLAKDCRRIVIQNLPGECDRIEAMLATEYELKLPIAKYPIPF